MEKPEETKPVAEEVKTTPAEFSETPTKAETPEEKTTAEPILSEREQARLDIENRVLGEPAPLPPEIKEEVKTEPEPEPEDATERLKAKFQKRIGKEVGKRKTLEEQLAEKDAEIERLRNGKIEPAPKLDEKKEPTLQEIAVALKKAREDGDTEFEVQILDYMAERRAKQERAEAEKQFETRNTQVTDRQRKWGELVQDYTVVDDGGKEVIDHPMNLNNMQSQLYKTANALYLDPELKRDRYSSGSEMENLRRAISDAYIELNKMGVGKTKEITEPKSTKERMKNAMVEPGAAKEETTELPSAPKLKSDQQNVQDEVMHRLKYKRDRETAFV